MSTSSTTYYISGMTCRSCEHIVRDSLESIKGVESVSVNLAKETVTVHVKGKAPSLVTLNAALKGTHYALSSTPSAVSMKADGLSWASIGLAIVAAVVLYEIMKTTGIITSAPAATEGATLTTVFIVGLAASVSSCLALVGGLLLSVSAAWSEAHQKQAPIERIKPLILFNVGRLAGYFLFGGIIGLIGHQLSLSVSLTGIITIALSIVMIMLGLNILNIVPKQYCTIPLPKAIWKRIHHLSNSGNPIAALILGALTFFVPCGYTLSMQLLSLSSGNFLSGGLIMFVFALGTLPSLLGIGVVSSLVHGRFARSFFRFSGALVILMGMTNIASGLTLAGVNVDNLLRFGQSAGQTQSSDPHVRIDNNGQQIITLNVTDAGYNPSYVTIDADKPTWVYAYAKTPVSGCAAFLTSPSFGIQTQINVGGNWLGPIKEPKSDFILACSMGMYRTTVHVRS